MAGETDSRRPPLVVVEGSDRALDVARRDVERAGWTVVDGWQPRADWPGDAVAVGVVADHRDAAAAVLAALAGAGVLVNAQGERALVDRLCDDLRRLGPVDHRTAEPSGDGPSLSADQERLVELLASGVRLGEAAAALHISRRTADRRLAEARAAYGVTTTAALLAEHARRRR